MCAVAGAFVFYCETFPALSRTVSRRIKATRSLVPLPKFALVLDWFNVAPIETPSQRE
jgi:hypothetical protein